MKLDTPYVAIKGAHRGPLGAGGSTARRRRDVFYGYGRVVCIMDRSWLAVQWSTQVLGVRSGRY